MHVQARILEAEAVEATQEGVATGQLQQRGVAFGAVPCGSSCSRTLGLVNRGRAAAFVSLEPSAELFDRLGIELIPAAGVMLRPREVAELTLWYR